MVYVENLLSTVSVASAILVSENIFSMSKHSFIRIFEICLTSRWI